MRSNCVPSLENLGLRYSFERCISYLNSAQLAEGVTMAGDSGRSGSVYGSVAEPCTVVLFGASGDLAKRKVIPAMYDLAIHNGGAALRHRRFCPYAHGRRRLPRHAW